jgi:ABC-2 type transport system permease protein
MLIAMIVSGAIGYYAASMLLAKSLRVFRGSWKGLAVMALCAAVICGVMKFDVFGIETRVPTADKIETLTFRVANNQYDLTPEEDGELLEEVRAAHLAIAEDADYIRSMDRNESRPVELYGDELSAYNTVRLTYHLKNGSTVTRRYSVPITADRLTQENTYDSALDRLVNGTAMKAKRFHLDDGYKADNGYLYLESRRDGGVTFGTHEAMVIHEAVKKDIAAGTCGNYNWFDNGRAGQYAIELNLDFRLEEKAENGANRDYYDYINVAVYPAMTHTVEALLALNLAEVSDLKTYAEMHPYDYDAKYQEYVETFGYVEYDDYLAVRHGVGEIGGAFEGASSIGVIGGADGPTAVYVTGG